jgi:hypothetical protein
MTQYVINGLPKPILGDGNVNADTITLTESTNPFTGAIGVVTIKVQNSSNTDVADFGFINDTTTYSFPNVSGTASGSGANATFDVTAAQNGYIVTLNTAGDGYIATETIVIDGASLGGANSTNDLTVTVSNVGNIGQITTFTSAGTVAWPQSGVQYTWLLPNSIEFIQATSGNTPVGIHIQSNCASGNVYVQPVTLVG